MRIQLSRLKTKPGGTFLVYALTWGTRLGRLALVVALLIGLYFAYRYSVHNIVNGSVIFGLIAFWVLTAYIALPRVHRQLTKIYLPDYYMGRARTSDGLLGDPINIAVNGSAKQLRTAMTEAGWVEADPTSIKTGIRIVRSIIFRQSYPAAPGSALFLFGNRQVFSFQKEINGSPNSRHHVRFWRTPTRWWLPGGYEADWLGAAHYDKHFGFSLFNLQFTHKITEHLDEERNFLVRDLLSVRPKAKVQTVEHFSSGFHGRNGGGDTIRTDGAMPFVDLRKT